MESAHTSLKSLLTISGAKGHLSDDEDAQISCNQTTWQWKRNNYFAQKRLLELDPKHGEDYEQKFLDLGSQKLGVALNNHMRELRASAIQSKLNGNKIQDSVKITKRLKAHSLEVPADDYYYYSKKYLSVLDSTKRMVNLCFLQSVKALH